MLNVHTGHLSYSVIFKHMNAKYVALYSDKILENREEKLSLLKIEILTLISLSKL